MENRKELIKKFHSLVSGGKSASRTFHVAYAFVRGMPYIALEKVINEDRFERQPGWEKYPCGVFSFLYFLAWSAAEILWNAIPEDKRQGDTGDLRDEIYAWMMKKYEDKTEVKDEPAKESAA